jgi:hypothetical protein
MILEQFKQQAIDLLKDNASLDENQFEQAIKLIESMKKPDEVESFKKNLLDKINNGKYYIHPEDIGVDHVSKLLSKASDTDVCIEDFNGCDQDWSIQVIIDEVKYDVWGSATSGGFCICASI